MIKFRCIIKDKFDDYISVEDEATLGDLLYKLNVEGYVIKDYRWSSTDTVLCKVVNHLDSMELVPGMLNEYSIPFIDESVSDLSLHEVQAIVKNSIPYDFDVTVMSVDYLRIIVGYDQRFVKEILDICSDQDSIDVALSYADIIYLHMKHEKGYCLQLVKSADVFSRMIVNGFDSSRVYNDYETSLSLPTTDDVILVMCKQNFRLMLNEPQVQRIMDNFSKRQSKCYVDLLVKHHLGELMLDYMTCPMIDDVIVYLREEYQSIYNNLRQKVIDGNTLTYISSPFLYDSLKTIWENSSFDEWCRFTSSNIDGLCERLINERLVEGVVRYMSPSDLVRYYDKIYNIFSITINTTNVLEDYKHFVSKTNYKYSPSHKRLMSGLCLKVTGESFDVNCTIVNFIINLVASNGSGS